MNIFFIIGSLFTMIFIFFDLKENKNHQSKHFIFVIPGLLSYQIAVWNRIDSLILNLLFTGLNILVCFKIIHTLFRKKHTEEES